AIFESNGLGRGSLSESCRDFIEKTGITPGLGRHGVAEGDLDSIADEAFGDPCHPGNMVQVTRDDMRMVLAASMNTRL
ncbi:MAG: iron-containing alcohol dehydrogenase, partial [Chrysiogenales bacterium]